MLLPIKTTWTAANLNKSKYFLLEVDRDVQAYVAVAAQMSIGRAPVIYLRQSENNIVNPASRVIRATIDETRYSIRTERMTRSERNEILKSSTAASNLSSE